MSGEGIVALALLALSQVFVQVVIRADERDAQAHQEWYDHPDRIRNQWKGRG